MMFISDCHIEHNVRQISITNKCSISSHFSVQRLSYCINRPISQCSASQTVSTVPFLSAASLKLHQPSHFSVQRHSNCINRLISQCSVSQTASTVPFLSAASLKLHQPCWEQFIVSFVMADKLGSGFMNAITNTMVRNSNVNLCFMVDFVRCGYGLRFNPSG
jgi:hypothetical protein